MKRLALAATIAVLLLPGVARAGAATDAALGLGAFAVFNQILSGTGIFGGAPAVAAPAPVVVAPPPPVVYQPAPVLYQPAPVVYRPAPVYVVPPPPPVAYYPAPPVYYAPRVIYVPRDNHWRHWDKHGRFEHGGWRRH
jgi:hypothetical protein